LGLESSEKAGAKLKRAVEQRQARSETQTLGAGGPIGERGRWHEAVSAAGELCGYAASPVRRAVPCRMRLAEADYQGVS
jgi:hypothetical protein